MDRIAAQVKKTKALVKEEKKRSATSRPAARGVAGGARPPRARRGSPRRETVTARPMFEEDALAAFDESANATSSSTATSAPTRRSASSTAARTAASASSTPD